MLTDSKESSYIMGSRRQDITHLTCALTKLIGAILMMKRSTISMLVTSKTNVLEASRRILSEMTKTKRRTHTCSSMKKSSHHTPVHQSICSRPRFTSRSKLKTWPTNLSTYSLNLQYNATFEVALKQMPRPTCYTTTQFICVVPVKWSH